MRRKIILLTIFLFVFGLAQGQTGHFFTAKSFSSGLISDLCQDKYGNIWIATDYGLNRFDGYQFKTYLHDKDDPGSLATSTIVTLLCDRGGHLWVGTNHGLDRYDPMSDAFVHYTFPAVVQPRISKMVQAADGTIIIGTAGFGAYSIGSDDVPVAFDIDGNEYYSNLFIDSHDRLWNDGFDDEIVMLLYLHAHLLKHGAATIYILLGVVIGDVRQAHYHFIGHAFMTEQPT
jgi:ligand-binding sensor domain-containing protein